MEKLSKGRQIVLYAAPFAPLAFFKVWASLGGRTTESFILVLSLLLVYCAVLIVLASRWDKPTYFDWAITGYFLYALLFFVGWPEIARPFFSRFGVTGIYGVLFLAAAVPLLLGKEPFTMHYARKYAPEGVWRNPVFLEINRMMTGVWSVLFLFCVLLSLYPSPWTRAVLPLMILLGFGLPFNLRYPDRHLKKVGLPSLRDQRKMVAEAGNKAGGLSAPQEVTQEVKVQGALSPDSSKRVLAEPFGGVPGPGVAERGMKVLALNSSPRSGAQSKTELLLGHLVQGMRRGGADVTLVDLRDKTVKSCIGCFSCWTKTPGACVMKDDMTEDLFPLWLRSDLVIYASPLYYFGLNATMRAFIERTLPALEPFFQDLDGTTAHPYRRQPPKAVVLSVAGLPEKSVFDQLSSWVKFIFARSGLAAEIYRPCAEVLTLPFVRTKAEEVFQALELAGEELASGASISPETLSRITQPLTDDDAHLLRTVGNSMWKSCISQGVTPREFEAKGGIPRPDSVDAFLKIMELGFRPEEAKGLAATIQFTFTGSVTESCYFTLERGSITTGRGRAATRADLTIDTPFDLWMDILTKEADGQEMFVEQKYRARGNIGLLMGMKDLFGAS